MKVATEFAVEPMRLEHIPAVSAIERRSFPQAWPQNAYRRELLENRTATYIVAKHVGRADALESLADQCELTLPADDGLFDRISRFLRGDPGAAPADSHEVDAELRSIIGYAGMWLMVDEAHVTTIASHPLFRGRGIGELLLLGLIDQAIAVGARWMTLEVRISNTVAQNLYRKYTFKEMGVRKRYYSDNNEDAMVMWTEGLDTPAFLEALDRNERLLGERLAAEIRLGGNAREVGR